MDGFPASFVTASSPRMQFGGLGVFYEQVAIVKVCSLFFLH
jgi:hypothetical protein